MSKFKQKIIDKISMFIIDYCEPITILLTVLIAISIIVIIKQGNQIKTQAEYIESQEWREYVEQDAEIESEHMNMLEEMRKGNL